MIRMPFNNAVVPLWLIAECYFLIVMTLKHFGDPVIYTWHFAMQIPYMWFMALPFLLLFGIHFDAWADKQPEPPPETNKYRRY